MYCPDNLKWYYLCYQTCLKSNYQRCVSFRNMYHIESRASNLKIYNSTQNQFIEFEDETMSIPRHKDVLFCK